MLRRTWSRRPAAALTAPHPAVDRGGLPEVGAQAALGGLEPLERARHVGAPAPDVVLVLDRDDAVEADLAQRAEVAAGVDDAEAGQRVAPPAAARLRAHPAEERRRVAVLVDPLRVHLGVLGVGAVDERAEL